MSVSNAAFRLGELHELENEIQQRIGSIKRNLSKAEQNSLESKVEPSRDTRRTLFKEYVTEQLSQEEEEEEQDKQARLNGKVQISSGSQSLDQWSEILKMVETEQREFDEISQQGRLSLHLTDSDEDMDLDEGTALLIGTSSAIRCYSESPPRWSVQPRPMHSRSHSSQKSFLQRQKQWENRTQLKLQKQRMLLREKELGPCTFSPSVICSRMRAEMISDPLQPRLLNKSHESNKKLEVLRKELAREERRKEMEQCTFKPRINKHSKEIANKLVRRGKLLPGQSPDRHAYSVKLYRGSHSEPNSVPRVRKANCKVVKTDHVRDYLSRDPFQRLWAQTTKLQSPQKIHREAQQMRSERSTVRINGPINPRTELWLSKLSDYEMKKKYRANQLQRRVNNFSYRPELNPHSLELAQESNQSFLQRQSKTAQKRDLFVQREKQEFEQAFSFKPQLSKVSLQMAAKIPRRGSGQSRKQFYVHSGGVPQDDFIPGVPRPADSINRLAQKSGALNKYLSECVVDRLTEKSKQLIHHRERKQGDPSDPTGFDIAEQSSPSPVKPAKPNSRVSVSEVEFEAFALRQREFEEKRKEKINRLRSLLGSKS